MRTEETWNQIPLDRLSGYYASTFGNIKRLQGHSKWNGSIFQQLPELIFTPTKNRSGYLVVNIKKRVYYVHRLIAETFVKGKKNDTNDVNHIDGNKQNNGAENLEWCTRKHNINHAFKIGLVNVGEKHHAARLTEQKVIEILRTHKKTGMGKVLLHRNYFPEVGISSIQMIIDGKNWKHIDRRTI